MSKRTVSQMMQRAASHEKKGEMIEAQVLYKSVLDAFPNNKRAKDALSMLSLPKTKLSANPAQPPKEKVAQLNALYQQGRFEDVVMQARHLVTQFPASFVLWSFLGAAGTQSNQNLLAVEAYQRASKLNPNDPSIHYSLGVTLQQAGNRDAALACYQRAIKLKPVYADALNNMGNILKEQGRLDDALDAFQRTLALKPHNIGTLSNMGNVLKEQGNFDEAIAAHQAALALKPDYLDALCNIGNAYMEKGQVDLAIESYQKALKIKPDHADAHCSMGAILKKQGKNDESQRAYSKAIRIDSTHVNALVGLSHVLLEKGLIQKALGPAGAAMRLAPKSVKVLNLMGRCHLDLLDPERAEIAFKRALEIKPNDCPILLSLGNLAVQNGEKDAARDYFNRAIAEKPFEFGGHLALINLSKVKEGDPAMAVIERAAQKTDKLNPSQLISLHYALGKGYEDLKRYEEAWENYAAGAALKRADIAYEITDFETLVDNIIKVMTADWIEKVRASAISDDAPIFVLGMPRSGTTLTETILASHPDVFGAGELANLHTLLVVGSGSRQKQFPLHIAGFEPAQFKAMAEAYVTAVRKFAPEKPHITDKMPDNFLFLGLIHAMLPNARIIHTVRNPVDTCLSNFTRLFARATQPQSYEQNEIARYHNAYRRLMAHWRAVLPKDAFLDFEYEGLIADFEPQARRLIDWAGLTWDDACLDFHQTKRNVRTASVTQVRQPIYATSVKKWENYRDHLQPMLQTLGVE